MEAHQTLFLRDGSMDKVYGAHLVPEGSGWVVKFEYGRRGSALKAGQKTATPVPLAEAQRIYDQLIAEKTAKGYSPGEQGVRFAGTALAGRKSNHVPQLLNVVEDLDAVLRNDTFCAQEKHDGERVLVEKTGTTVVGINRRGLTRPLPEPLVAAVAKIHGDVVLDGELVGTSYYVFDVVAAGPYGERLGKATDAAQQAGAPVKIVATARGTAAKTELLATVTARGGEGVVFKDWNAPRTPGRPASGGPQLKHKLTQSATCIVLGAKAGKRSIELGLLEDGQVRNVGAVTIPVSHDVPEKDSLVEVRYLYAHRGGALFQPTYLGERNDLDVEDCRMEQLKFKADP